MALLLNGLLPLLKDRFIKLSRKIMTAAKQLHVSLETKDKVLLHRHGSKVWHMGDLCWLHETRLV